MSVILLSAEFLYSTASMVAKMATTRIEKSEYSEAAQLLRKFFQIPENYSTYEVVYGYVRHSFDAMQRMNCHAFREAFPQAAATYLNLPEFAKDFYDVKSGLLVLIKHLEIVQIQMDMPCNNLFPIVKNLNDLVKGLAFIILENSPEYKEIKIDLQ